MKVFAGYVQFQSRKGVLITVPVCIKAETIESARGKGLHYAEIDVDYGGSGSFCALVEVPKSIFE